MAKAHSNNTASATRATLRYGAAASLVVLALAGCREAEQDRVLWYEPGVYKGERQGAPLTEGDLAELRERTLMQGGVGVGRSLSGLSGGSRTTGSNVRPPAPKPAEPASN